MYIKNLIFFMNTILWEKQIPEEVSSRTVDMKNVDTTKYKLEYEFEFEW